MSLLLLALLAPADAAELFEGRAFYFGDLHVHTGYSGDGYSVDVGPGCADFYPDCGAAVDVFAEARALGLDFAAIADHANNHYTMDAEGFERVHALALAAHDPDGGFLTIPAVELHFSLGEGAILGHKNLYMFADNAILEGMTLEDVRWNEASMVFDSCEAVWSWVEGWRARWGEAWLVPHHPATVTSPHPTDWSCSHPTLQPVVEIYSKHGNGLTTVDDYDLPITGVVAESLVHNVLDSDGLGLQLGFISSTDDHHSRPGSNCEWIPNTSLIYGGGLAAVVLDEGAPFTRTALGEAFTRRSVYATSGPRLPVVVEYRVEGELVEGMGEVATLPAGAPVSAEVRVPSSEAHHVTSVELRGPQTGYLFQDQGEGVWAIQGVQPEAWFYPVVLIDGASWYPGGCEDGGATRQERVWLSPTWFVETDAPDPVDTADTATVDTQVIDSDPPTADSADSEVEEFGDTEADETPAGVDPPDEPRGCGCSGGGGAGFGWLLVAAALRRRREAR